jgi:hypothetical protein
LRESFFKFRQANLNYHSSANEYNLNILKERNQCLKRCPNAINSDRFEDYAVNKRVLEAAIRMAGFTSDGSRDKTIRIGCCPYTIDTEKF